MDRKRLLWFGISTLMLAVLVYLADFSKFVAALTLADTRFVALAIVLGVLPYLVWGFTWYRIINSIGLKISYKEVLPVFFAGDFLNKITPLGQFGGEPFMAYILREKTELSYEESFAAVLSSDIVNVIPMFTFVLVGGALFLSGIGSSALLQQLVLVTFGIGVLGGTMAYLIWFRSGTIERNILYGLDRFTGFIGRGDTALETLEKKLESVEKTFSLIGDEKRTLLLTTVVAHLAFVFRVFCLYIVLISLGIGTDLYTIIFILPLCSVSNFSPTPGGTGTYEGAMSVLLVFFYSITLSQALAAAVIFRIVTFGSGLILGYFAFNTVGQVGGRE